MRVKNLLRFFLGIPLTLIAFVFIGKVFYDSWDQVSKSVTSIKPELFILGILFYSSFFALKSYIWTRILETHGHKIIKRETFFYYSLSEIKRYIPGSIFAFIGRVATHKTIPKKETLKGIGIEAILLVLSALSVSIPSALFLLLKFNPSLSPYAIPAIFTLLMFLAILVLLNHRVRLLFTKYIDAFSLFVVAWFLYGVGSLLILLSLTSVDPSNFLAILSLFVLSWAGGYLVFVMPMGLGARELVTVFSLSLFIATPIASVAAVVTRLGMIIGEIFYLVLTYSIKGLKSNSYLFKLNPYLIIAIAFALLYFSFFSY
jgi:uncharacterized membrane protein YbhN (UPF0104 family)